MVLSVILKVIAFIAIAWLVLGVLLPRLAPYT